MTVTPPRIAALALLSLLFAAFPAVARPGSAWLEFAPGARAAALGEAVTATPDGPSAAFWNPAAVGRAGNGLEAMHSQLFVESGSAQFVALELDRERFGFGLSVLHLGVGDMELRDGPSSDPSGTFDSRNYALGLSGAWRITPSLRFGASGRYLSEAIHVHTASGWSGDLGLLWSGLLDNHVSLGATVRHLGRMEALESRRFELPTTGTAGLYLAGYTFGFVQPSLAADLAWITGGELSPRLGLEAVLFQRLALRAGWTGGREAQGFAAGFGIHWEGWRFDYAYTPMKDDLGASQRVSVGVSW
jgi:hypothetical protein